MLSFDKNIQEVVANQETVRKASAFTEYNSKKKLFDAGILSKTQQSYISQLKGTFTFHIHNENRYLVVTMYYSREKKYGFLVVDLETLKCAEVDSVKNAKNAVMEIVAAKNVAETVEAETVEAETEETPVKKSNKAKK